MKILILFFFFIVLNSCTFKSVVFKNLPYILTQFADDSLDLTWSQEKEFKAEINDILKSNSSGLAGVLKVLKEFELEESSLKKSAEKVYPFLDKLSRDINFLASKYLAKLDQDQIKFLYDKLEDENETIKNRWKKNKSKEIAKRYEFFFGKLNNTQIKLIESNISIYQNLNRIRLERRLYVQKKMKDIFKLEDSNTQRVEFQNLLDSQLNKEKMLSNFNKSIELISKIVMTLDKKQKTHYEKKKAQIIDWIESYILYLNQN